MMLRAMIAIVTGELKQWPRGPRGSAQNLFRLAFWAYRMNSLGRHAAISCSAAAAADAALSMVHKDFPGFQPTYVG